MIEETPPLSPVPMISEPIGPQTEPDKLPNRSRLKQEMQHVDVHVGGRMRLRRMLLGLSQSQLGEALGLTFQQVQKYEHGTTRMSAAMLHRAAEVLDIPISFFFDGLPAETLSKGWSAPSAGVLAPDLLSNLRPALLRDLAEFVEIYITLPAEVRQGLLDIVRATSRNLSGAAKPT